MSKNTPLNIRCEPSEKELFAKAASNAGLSLSAWMRSRLLQTARKELTKAR